MQIVKPVLAAALLASTLIAQQDVPDLKHRSAPASASITLPRGTALHISLDQEISTESAKISDGFSAHLVDPISLDGSTVIPAGTVVRGRVKDVSAPGRRFHGKTTLTLRPETIIMADGTQTDISATMTDTYDRKAYKLDSEGTISNSARHYTKMSAATGAAGAVAGGVLFGPMGAAKGAAVGASLPAARWVTKVDHVVLPSGSDFWFEISRPATLRTTQATESKTATPATDPSN